MEETNRQAGNKPAVASASVRERARENFERALGEVLLFMGGHPLYEQVFLSEIRELGETICRHSAYKMNERQQHAE